MKLTEPFHETDLPFAGTCIAWSGDESKDRSLMSRARRLQGMKCWTAPFDVSCEILETISGTTKLSVGGIYPVLDMAEGDVGPCFDAVSFIRNRTTTDKLLDWTWTSVIRGALKSDPAGMFIAIHAKGSEIGDAKMREAVALVTAD
jgi:hypothetical protein